MNKNIKELEETINTLIIEQKYISCIPKLEEIIEIIDEEQGKTSSIVYLYEKV
jgi:hypothetical protein